MFYLALLRVLRESSRIWFRSESVMAFSMKAMVHIRETQQLIEQRGTLDGTNKEALAMLTAHRRS